jgi:hypothetical protein
MLTLIGHMSRAMLERYAHAGMAVERITIDSLILNREQPTADASTCQDQTQPRQLWIWPNSVKQRMLRPTSQEPLLSCPITPRQFAAFELVLPRP